MQSYDRNPQHGRAANMPCANLRRPQLTIARVVAGLRRLLLPKFFTYRRQFYITSSSTDTATIDVRQTPDVAVLRHYAPAFFVLLVLVK